MYHRCQEAAIAAVGRDNGLAFVWSVEGLTLLKEVG